MKKLIIAILVATLFLLMTPIAVSAAGVIVVRKAGDGEWDGNTWQVEMYPGETKSTTLTLYNSSNVLLRAEIAISPVSQDNGNLTFKLSKASFILLGRAYSSTTLIIKASNSATPGTYTTELTIKSEVPPTPTPSQPTYPEPDIEEPEEEEPEEPIVEEPEEPTPEEPEPEEPVEPEEPEEPTEPIEPEEPVEPIEPVEPEEPEKPEVIIEEEPCRWSLLDSILAGLVLVMLGLDIWQWRRRRD